MKTYSTRKHVFKKNKLQSMIYYIQFNYVESVSILQDQDIFKSEILIHENLIILNN